ncbi:MAG: glutathione S-transferase family protein [Myxococcota bacterium]
MNTTTTPNLKLQTLPGAFGVRGASSFALKAEALLSLAGLEYEREVSQPRFGPRQKMPVLHHGTVVVPDTRNIQNYLEREFGADFDGHLAAEDRARIPPLRRMLEEHLYFVQLYFRWNDHADLVKETFFADVPWLLRSTVFRMVRKKVDQQLWAQGTGRLPREEMIERAREDLEALHLALGDRPFFFADRPGSLDATVYPLLLNFVAPAAPSPLVPWVRPFADYIERAEQHFFGSRPALADLTLRAA